MKTSQITPPRAALGAITTCVGALLFGAGLQEAAAQVPLEITTAGLVGGKVALNWTSNSYAYEVQSTESLVTPNWRPVLATSRTNGLIPLNGSSGFLRVVGPRPNAITLAMAFTNLATSEVFALRLQAQTNADLVFNGPTNWNGLDLIQFRYRSAELEKVDVLFDSAGGFTYVSANGNSIGSGGQWTITAGPGTNEVTYNGIVTNGLGVQSFSAIVGSAAARPGGVMIQGDEGGTAGTGGNVANAGIIPSPFQQCQNALTLQGLGCSALCPGNAIGCLFQGKGSFCSFEQNISWGSTNLFGYPSVCEGECKRGCK